MLNTANGALYKRIREGLNDAAAVEMEGWGAMKAAQLENTPAIVVRGISDRCNGKDPIEDAAFQPIAAAHAAAMAMKILSIRSMAGERGAGAWRGEPKPPDDKPYPEYFAWHVKNAPTVPFEKLLKSGDWHSIPDLATHSPSVFLRTLWPFYERLFRDLAAHEDDRPDRFNDSSVVEFDFDDGGPAIILGEGDILSALRIAVEAVAADDAPSFLEWAVEKSVIAFAPCWSRAPTSHSSLATSRS